MRFIGQIFSFILIIPIKFYQWVISPFIPPSCRHVPTCSNYSIEALKVHGPIRGFLLATNRIFRCNPWGTEGFDPVPQKMTRAEWKEYRKTKKLRTKS